MPERDLYQALGVRREASEEEVRAAYRRLARRFHPDVNPNDARAEERFKEISFAYEVLSDAEKRRGYDEFGTDALAQGFDPDHARTYRRWSQGARRSPFSESFGGHLDLEDLIAQAMGRGGASRGPRRGADAQGRISVDFMAAVRGEETRVELAGRGAIRVRIPRGADEGTRIRLAGQGEPGAQGGPPGDLYLTLHVRPHPFFRREGADLMLDLPVTLAELIQGASVEVPTPEGSVKMTLPEKSAAGSRLRLRGKGVPGRAKAEPGDLLVRLMPVLPDTADPRLQEIALELETLYEGQDVRESLKETL